MHTIRRYIREFKGDSRRQAVATVRFETAPGQQAQCDWGHVGRFETASGKPVDIYVFVTVLSFSRMMYIRFSTSMKIPALIEGHLLAFEAWQGVPRTILYDNMAQVRTGPGKLNTTFADFAAHHGFEVKTHRPYRPRTKGKVERSVDYIKGNFLNGRSFDGLEDLNRQGERWLAEVANVRLHATTGERPLDLWKQEKGAFTPLDIARPYLASRRVERKVSVDTLVAFENSRYSVPPQYIDEPVVRNDASGNVTYYHRNQQYSVTAITNDAGSVLERYAYDAYGGVTFVDSSGTNELPKSNHGIRQLYTGREWDEALELYHYRARMYDADSGRFVSKDPIGFEGSPWNTYEYVAGNPLIYADPLGESHTPLNPIEKCYSDVDLNYIHDLEVAENWLIYETSKCENELEACFSDCGKDHGICAENASSCIKEAEKAFNKRLNTAWLIANAAAAKCKALEKLLSN